MEPHLQMLQLLKQNYPDAHYYLRFSNPLELLIATMLAPQTRDVAVNKVTEQLFLKYKTAEDYSQADPEELLGYLSAINYAAKKVQYIQTTCRFLIQKCQGQVPDTMEALTELPGVGRKTANSILINAFNKVVGISVDVHVIRLSQRMGWTKQQNPEKIEKDLMSLFSQQEWKTLSWLLKAHGQKNL